MPVHSHDRAERLEPERMGEPAEKLIAAELMDDRFGDHGAKAGHAVAQPFRNPPTMEGQIGTSGSLRHFRLLNPRTAVIP